MVRTSLAENHEHRRFRTWLLLGWIFGVYERHTPLEKANLRLPVNVLVKRFRVRDGIDEHDDRLALFPLFVRLFDPKRHL